MRDRAGCQPFLANSIQLNVPFVPGIPDYHIGQIVFPGHSKKIETAIFKQPHAIVFYGDLLVIGTRPFSQEAFGISISHDHYVQGLGGPICGYGHLV